MMKFLFLLIVPFLGCGKTSSSAPDKGSGIEVPSIDFPSVGNISLFSKSTTKAILKSKVENTGGASIIERGICWAIHNNPTIDDSNAPPNSLSGTGEFEVELTNLEGGKTYYAKSFASNSKGRSYGPLFEFKSESYNDAKMGSASVLFYKLNSIEVSSKIEDTGGANIIEAGICFGTTQNPTVDNNNVIADKIENLAFKVNVIDLELGKSYFIRSYVKTSKGVYYSSQGAFQTYNKGKITVNFHNQSNIPTDVFARLKTMADHGVKLLEEYTSIVKTVTIEYNTGVGTADASISGWMRWGSNTSYQKTGTFLHEFAHAIGAGTSNVWKQTLIQNGIYLGQNANLALRKASNDSSAQLKGDLQHFWPYGINGAHEDTGRESDYIITCLIIEGFKRDGVPIN
ncbi:hypothetical protein [Sphingobacterium bovistauri]|uniref:Uncharacterized protein n=1 Tax=Sphingobacterium bovistauri TaxID=2781959 RepID=A0ABS7Z8C4_9SPHI|nr:hypothetical protein [Sphingobacterium bovistauri]MCA5005199.1 hypothetical protein [Sphingobacterium bovistauri]